MRLTLVTAAAAAALVLPSGALGAAPPNDDRANATAVGSLPFTVTEDVSGATKDDPTMSGWPQVWFRYTPAHDLSLELDSTGSTVQTHACVWIGYSQQVCSGDGFSAHMFVDLTAGTTYDLEIQLGSCCSGGETLQLSLRDRSVANDEIGNAVQVAALPFQDFRDTTRATSAPDDPWCEQYANSSVWYAYTPPTDETVLLKTYGSDYMPYVCAYTGTGQELTQVASGWQELQVLVQAGTTYWLGAFANGGDHSHLTLSLTDAAASPAVANDELDAAAQLTGSSFSVSQDTTLGTAAADDPSCYGRNGSVWYTFTAAESGTATLSTAGSDYDARASIWTGSRGSLWPLNAGDSSDCDVVGDHTLSFPVEAGVRYSVLVNAPWGVAPGHLVLDGVLPVPPLTLAVLLAPKGTVDRTTGIATIAGAVTCDRPAEITVKVGVAQAKAVGTAATTTDCTPGSYAPYVVEVRAGGKGAPTPFAAGDADVTATVSACDTVSCGNGSTAATVKLLQH
jgi:hypothetical protein